MSPIRNTWLPILDTCWLMSLSSASWSQAEPPAQLQASKDDTLTTLQRFSDLRLQLKTQINDVEKQIKTSPSESEKKQLQAELATLEKNLNNLKENFVEIAAGIGYSAVAHKPQTSFNLQSDIENLVELKSRPARAGEPWFPCRKDDWVLLSDGIRGKVVGISHEFVELIDRGGAPKTYLTQDFLAQSPRNLSVGFRLKETIGISYDLQAESTSGIPQTLKEHLLKCIEAEGYGESIMNMQVEFGAANTSSLDLVVIADLKGEMAPLYNRLRRAIQRWSVDACTLNNWEIPFTQITLHNGP